MDKIMVFFKEKKKLAIFLVIVAVCLVIALLQG